ncbi:major facilitator superfamily domain-containing protein [Tuber borchii]|uniref:Major facilitator superfamily domain-containing protein n=1 Tax=Tuber borchii TaxID=42251 RepID=A0A2T6ZUV2_TUBBO|nr:major facilitator superfamily domain-containing protein [Tuber borchii]
MEGQRATKDTLDEKYETVSDGELWSTEEEARVRRQLDWRLIPLLTVLYLLCFTDRWVTGWLNARIQGMQQDLKLVGFRFNWALTAFYLTYFLVEIPSNILLKRIGPKIYIPALVIAFGIVSIGTAFVKNFQGLCVARAFLGIAEGGTMPGMAFFMSCFYKRGELLLRVAILASAASLAGAFGGLLATALSRIPKWGANGLEMHTWRNIFLFEGILTVGFGILGYFLMPESPGKCVFLSERQRWIAAERIRVEHKELTAERTELWHVKRGMFNINNIICCMGFLFCNVTVQSFSLFLPTILSALGWRATKAQLLTVPPYAVACCFTLYIARLSDRYRRRGLFVLVCAALTLTGYSILVSVNEPYIKYTAVFLAASGSFPLGPLFLSWGLNNAAGPSVRAVTGAYIVSLGQGGAILATWTYVPSDAPRYIRGHSINLGAQVGAALMGLLGILYARWENTLRDRGGRDNRLVGLTEEQVQKLGYRHPDFRYIE